MSVQNRNDSPASAVAVSVTGLPSSTSSAAVEPVLAPTVTLPAPVALAEMVMVDVGGTSPPPDFVVNVAVAVTLAPNKSFTVSSNETVYVVSPLSTPAPNSIVTLFGSIGSNVIAVGETVSVPALTLILSAPVSVDASRSNTSSAVTSAAAGSTSASGVNVSACASAFC